MDGPPATERRPGRARRRLAALALAVLGAAALLPGAGADLPLEEHEVFVARTATEMLRSGDWLVPTFDGAPRLEKPPMSYWLAALVHLARGEPRSKTVDERSARLPSMLAAIALGFVAAAIARRAFDSELAGHIAAASWITSAGAFQFARNARPEMVYAMFCGLAVLGFLRLSGAEGRARLPAALLAWGGWSAALLTKGPLLPSFLLVGLVAARLRARPPALRKALAPGVGLGVVLATAGVYFGLVALRIDGAAGLWGGEMSSRVGDVGVLQLLLRPLRPSYLLGPLPLLLPWIAVLPAAVLSLRAPAPAARTLACVVASVVLILGFSERSHAYYLLPVLPLVFALGAGGAARYLQGARGGASRGGRLLAGHAVVLGALAVGLVVLGFVRPETRPGPASFAVLAVGVAAAALLIRRDRSTERLLLAVWALALGDWSFVGASHVGWTEERFTKHRFAAEVAERVPPDRPILAESGPRELLIYYGDRTIPRVALDRLGEALEQRPDALVLTRRDKVLRGDLNGAIVVAEEESGGRAAVLIEPSRPALPER